MAIIPAADRQDNLYQEQRRAFDAGVRLQPHTIHIIPDNDRSGVGLRGAHLLARYLAQMGVVQDARIIELPHWIKDVRDFAVRGGSVDDLHRLALHTTHTVTVTRR